MLSMEYLLLDIKYLFKIYMCYYITCMLVIAINKF